MSTPFTPLPRAFAAKKTDGTVVVWGDASRGGDATVPNGPVDLTGVDTIYSTERAFAAREGTDGTVVVLGVWQFLVRTLGQWILRYRQQAQQAAQAPPGPPEICTLQTHVSCKFNLANL